LGFQFGATQGTKVLKIGTYDITTITSWSNSKIEAIVPSVPVGDYKIYIKEGSEVISTQVPFSVIGGSDLLGTWPSGTWYRNSDTGNWIKLGPSGELVSAGDLDGDGTDDLLWSKMGDGVWVNRSSWMSWTRYTPAAAGDLTSGDMNGDGRDDLLGIWISGVYYKDSIGGGWVKIAPSADLIAAGDLDGDGTDDCLWSKAGDGVWVKSSTTMSWTKLTPAAAGDIASGDMNGDGRDDLVGSWNSGVYYKDSIGGSWVMMAPSADLVAAGDLDGDGTEDLLWSKASNGVWVKYPSTLWDRLTPAAATHMDAGWMRAGTNPWPSAAIEGFVELSAPIGGSAIGPGTISDYEDLSDEGPGGWNFVYTEEANLIPQNPDSAKIMAIPGPEEPGFQYIEQLNLAPAKNQGSKKEKDV
jgi:hypothetical protein